MQPVMAINRLHLSRRLAMVGVSFASFLCVSVLAQAPSPGAIPAARAPAAKEADAMDSLLDFAVQPADPEEAQANRIEKLLAESAGLRDPFWPVGYQPPKPKAKTEAQPQPQQVEQAPRVDTTPRWDEALKTVSIKGIMSVGGGKYMAVINDQVVSENDTVSATYMGRSYSWKVSSINAQGVKFQKLDSGAR